MDHIEVAMWSACLGIYFCYTFLSLFYGLYYRSAFGLQTMALGFLGCLCVTFSSGLGALLFKDMSSRMELNLVMGLAALASSYGILGLRVFLRAGQRDKIVDRGLLFVAVIYLSQLVGIFWPDQRQALEAMGIVSVLAAVAACWLTLRAWLLGDGLALPLSLSSLALVFGMLGLYGLPLGMFKDNYIVQAVAALSMSLHFVLICHVVLRRHAEHRRMSHALATSRQKDLLTQLWTGTAFIRRIDDAIVRARRNRKELALICVEIYNTKMLRQEFGHNGVEQVIYGLATRIRKAGGTISEIGRYTDTSFVMVLDSVDQASYLRTLGLRISAGVRRPYLLNAFSSDPREFHAEVGIGVSRVGYLQTVNRRPANTISSSEFDSFTVAQNMLHEAAAMARAATHFQSKAAILNDSLGKSIDLKFAKLI